MRIKISAIIVFLCILVPAVSPFVYSHEGGEFVLPGLGQSITESPSPTPDTTSGKLNDIKDKIKELEGKLNDLRSTEKTLQSQIDVVDNQIELTQLRINSTESEISELTEDIDIAVGKVDHLEDSIGKISEALLNRIVATYKAGSLAQSPLFVNADTFADYFTKMNYLRIIQAQDRKLLYETHQAQLDYENQKNIFEDKKAKVVALQVQLEEYKAQIDEEKKGKEDLLKITKNDEEEFQSLLNKLRADAASISQAIGNIGYKIGSVSKGEAIAAVGSSGCSTGPHLHLEVYTNAKVEDGEIIGNRVDPKLYLEDSKYVNPVPNYPGNVTAWYGEIYFLGTHTGLDIANPYGTPIVAMDSGDAYYTSAPCNLNIAGGSSMGKGIVVDHKNGMVSLYWHIP